MNFPHKIEFEGRPIIITNAAMFDKMSTMTKQLKKSRRLNAVLIGAVIGLLYNLKKTKDKQLQVIDITDDEETEVKD